MRLRWEGDAPGDGSGDRDDNCLRINGTPMGSIFGRPRAGGYLGPERYERIISAKPCGGLSALP